MENDNLSTKAFYDPKPTTVNNINVYLGRKANKSNIFINTEKSNSIPIDIHDDEENHESSIVKKTRINTNENKLPNMSFENIFKYDGVGIMILNIDDEFWFKGNELAILLGYASPKKALQNNIKSEHKKSYEELLRIDGAKNYPDKMYQTKQYL